MSLPYLLFEPDKPPIEVVVYPTASKRWRNTYVYRIQRREWLRCTKSPRQGQHPKVQHHWNWQVVLFIENVPVIYRTQLLLLLP